MDTSFDDITIFFHEVDTLDRNDAYVAAIPRFPKCYLRDVVNPFDYYSDQEFKTRFRFSKNTVLSIILPEITSLQTISNRGLPIPLDLQLLITLRFYATASFQKVCGDLTYISQPTVCHIVKRVSNALASTLPKYVHYPGTEGLEIMKIQFKNLGARRNLPGLPNIIGAIDCTHIKINRPRGINHSEAYRNRHGWFSVNVQAIVAADMTVLDIVVRWPGSSHDSRIFRNSRIHARLVTGELNGILVGDGGYACTGIMLTPLRSPSTPAEEKYNEVQIRTRNVVERTFGVLKRRFPCLQRGLSYKLVTSCNIILACTVLHNIAIKHEGTNDYENFEELSSGLPQPEVQAGRHAAEGLALRSQLIRNLYT